MLTRRAHTPEFMDDPAIDRDELREHLRFIRMVNSRLGGTSAALGHFKRWSSHWRASLPVNTTDPMNSPLKGGDKGAIRVLDVGTGSADIPIAIARWAQRGEFRVHITAIDLHALTVELAREYVAENEWRIPSVQGDDPTESLTPPSSLRRSFASSLPIEILQLDALKLMDHFAPGNFHYAHAGMSLHHLDDIEVMTVLRIMDRLTTRALIWNDLIRSPVSRFGVRVLAAAAPPKVRHDAIASIEKGFTKREALDLASRAGLTSLKFTRHLFGRFTLTSEKDLQASPP